MHTVNDTWKHGSATREDDIAVEITTDTKVTLEDRVVAK